MNRNYVRGRAFEYEIMKKLKAIGWTCERAAASHGPVDIFAGRRERSSDTPNLRLIQAKNYKPSPGGKEIREIYEELREAQSAFGGMGILVYKHKGKIHTRWCGGGFVEPDEFYWEGLTTP